jgi:hypothetical protein
MLLWLWLVEEELARDAIDIKSYYKIINFIIRFVIISQNHQIIVVILNYLAYSQNSNFLAHLITY